MLVIGAEELNTALYLVGRLLLLGLLPKVFFEKLGEIVV